MRHRYQEKQNHPRAGRSKWGVLGGTLALFQASRRIWHGLVSCTVSTAFVLLLSSAVAAEGRIIEQQPFDRLTLTSGQTLDLLPIEMEKRRPLARRSPEQPLHIRLRARPEQEYEVKWADIAHVQLFEELVMAEAASLVNEQRFDDAYEYYEFLLQRSPDFPGLIAAKRACLFEESKSWQKLGKFRNALVALNELYSQDPDYPGLKQALGLTIDRLVVDYFSAGKAAAARQLLLSLAKKYPGHPVVQQRQSGLIEQATKVLGDARQLAADGKMLEADEAVAKSLAIWPKLGGAHKLQAELFAKHPIVRVGVRRMAPVVPDDPVPGWAAIRSRRLTDWPLFQIAVYPPQGNGYRSSLVDWTIEGDRLLLAARSGMSWSGTDVPFQSADVARTLSSWVGHQRSADLGRSDVPAGAVKMLKDKRVALRWPHRPVCWQAWLQVPILSPENVTGSARLGPFQVTERTAAHVRYVRVNDTSTSGSKGVREVIERPISSAGAALEAFRDRTILAFDRVLPWELAQVARQPDLTLVRYAAPTVHLLVLNTRRPLGESLEVRRALAYSTNREEILASLFAGGKTPVGCVLDGPFPHGDACDPRLHPRAFDPRLAVGLLRVWQVENGVDPSKRTKLQLVHLASETASRATHALSRQWNLADLGFDVEIRETTFAELTDPGNDRWDVFYFEWHAMQPFVDAERLLGATGFCRNHDPELQAALRELAQAQSRDNAFSTLRRIHRLVYQRLPVIGLWQLNEYAACDKRLLGVGDQPVSLYQNIDSWSVQFDSAKP